MNRNRVLYFALLVLLAGCSETTGPTAEPPPSPSPNPFPATHMSTEDLDEARDVAVTPDGGALVVSLTGGSYWLLRRHNNWGELTWEQKVNRCVVQPILEGPVEPGTPSGCSNQLGAVATDSSGNAYVLSQTLSFYAQQGSITRAFFSKYAIDGTLLWDKQVAELREDDGERSGQGISDFAVDGSGNAYLLALDITATYDTPPSRDAMLLKYDTLGQKLWEKPGGYPETSKVVTSGGNVYTAGVAHRGTSEATTELRKLTGDGDMLWQRSISETTLDHGAFVSLAVSGDTHVYVVTGVERVFEMYNNGVVKITKFGGDGTLLWDEILTPKPDRYWGLGEAATDTKGRLYIVGANDDSTDFTVYNSAFALRYSPDGTRDWVFTLDGSSKRGVLSSSAYPLAIATFDTGSFYGEPQTRLYIAGFSETHFTGSVDAFLLSVADVTEDADYLNDYKLETNWVKY